jgi:hypothetical protein
MTQFQSDAFRATEYKARTDSVVVESLADFFPDGEPRFTVRGLTAVELQRCYDAQNRQKSVDSVVKALAASRDQVNEIRKALGLTDDVPGETAKRIEMLVIGSVTPSLTHADVVKLAEICPVEFMDLTNKITVLTGLGFDRVKPKPSSQQTPA